MHLIELHIHRFLQKINKGNGYKIPQELLEKFSENSKAHLKRQFERTSSVTIKQQCEAQQSYCDYPKCGGCGFKEKKNFTLRMSNVGHNLCQLECEQAGIPGEDTTNVIRMLYGDVCEDILLFLLLASGVPVVSSQEQVSLKLGKHKIDGTLDVVIEFLGDVAKVWDLKSVSEWVFKNKCKSYEDFVKGDLFGYRDQLFLYASARNAKAGGWIIQNKSDGSIRVIEAPEEQQSIRRTVLRETEAKLDLLNRKTKSSTMVHLDRSSTNEQQLGLADIQSTTTASNSATVKRSIPSKRLDTIEETFRGKPTGNHVLDIPCIYCSYKWHCWPKLQMKPKAKSTAKDPILTWYAEYKDDHSLSK